MGVREKIGCRIQFLPIEVAELIFATIMLSTMFVIAYGWDLGVSLLLGALGLMIHELGHKVVGRIRCIPDVHFTLSPFGIGVGYAAALLIGHALAAPGGVTVGEESSENDRLLMALGGPMANLLLFFVFLGLHLWEPFVWQGQIGAATEVNIWLAAAFINLYLGFFNLLPIPMFDGSHIKRYSTVVWGVSIGAFAMIAVLVWPFVGSELSALFQGTWGGLIGETFDFALEWMLPFFPGFMVMQNKQLQLSAFWAHSAGEQKYERL